MRKMKAFVLILILSMIFFMSFTTASDKSRDEAVLPIQDGIQSLTISPGDDIQEALNRLEDGGILILSSGSYDITGTVVLENRKDLTLEGVGEVWINTKGIDHHVITLVNCHRITLKNIKAQHVILEEGDNDPIKDPTDGAVLGALGGSSVSIISCELVGCGIYGIYAYESDSLLLEDCYLHHNSKNAALFKTGAKPMDVVIKDCIITDNAGTIEVQGDVDVHMRGKNTIERNTPGDYSR